MLNFWYNLTINNDKLSGICCKLMINQNYKWITYVKNLIDTAGVGYIWNQAEHIKKDHFKDYFKNLYNDWNTQWDAQMSEKNTCKVLRHYKHTPAIERYLNCLSTSERKFISRFRCGNRLFPAYNNEKPNKECSYCTNGLEGDEYHYFLICPPLHSNEQNSYLRITIQI